MCLEYKIIPSLKKYLFFHFLSYWNFLFIFIILESNKLSFYKISSHNICLISEERDLDQQQQVGYLVSKLSADMIVLKRKRIFSVFLFFSSILSSLYL